MKYPRTPHLPFSPSFIWQNHHANQSNNSDEPDIGISLDSCNMFVNEEIVITEKLDGGNCAIHQGKVYGRSHSEEATHGSFGPIKELASQIGFMLEEDVWLFGENMFGIHSIEYDGLKSFFYLFAVLKGTRWLSWDEVTEMADNLGIPSVPVLFRGKMTSLNDLQHWKDSRLMTEKSQIGTIYPEGYVVRKVNGFETKDFERNMAKYVREEHIQTDENWRRNWKPAKLSKD